MFKGLFGFLMKCVTLAETAILLCFHSVGMLLFVFGTVVIPLFTFSTLQSNSGTHNFHLHWFVSQHPAVFGHKKRTASVT